jgi:CRISPR-associated endonuclease Cas1
VNQCHLLSLCLRRARSDLRVALSTRCVDWSTHFQDRHARHPVNAMLNYGYAVPETQVRIAIAEAGLDPSVGYLHVCQPGRQAFVYDLMEPYRPEVDRGVLAFVRSQTFTQRDFVIDPKGVCRSIRRWQGRL